MDTLATVPTIAPAFQWISIDSIDDLQPQGRTIITFGDGLALDIAERGLLHPVGVEDIGNGCYSLLYGHRRLRGVRTVLDELGDHPRFPDRSIPAFVFPRLTESERLAHQLAENTKRTALKPGEWAKQVMLARNAILAAKLRRRLPEIGIPTETDEHPKTRYDALDALRRQHNLSHEAAVSLEETLAELGETTVGQRQAHAAIAAYCALPEEWSGKLDQQAINDSVRRRFVALFQKNETLATDLFNQLQKEPDITLGQTLEAAANATANGHGPDASTIIAKAKGPKSAKKKKATKEAKEERRNESNNENSDAPLFLDDDDDIETLAKRAYDSMKMLSAALIAGQSQPKNRSEIVDACNTLLTTLQ